MPKAAQQQKKGGKCMTTSEARKRSCATYKSLHGSKNHPHGSSNKRTPLVYYKRREAEIRTALEEMKQGRRNSSVYLLNRVVNALDYLAGQDNMDTKQEPLYDGWTPTISRNTDLPLTVNNCRALLEVCPQARRMFEGARSLLDRAELTEPKDFELACEIQRAAELLMDNGFALLCEEFIEGELNPEGETGMQTRISLGI